jgi:hypothetical protein
MWAIHHLSGLFSVLLIIAVSWAAAVNPGFARNPDMSSCSGNKADTRFRLEVAPAAIIAPNNVQDRQTGIQFRKISLVYGLTSVKAFNQGPVLWALGNHASLSALITKFKSPSLFALRSCLTV